MPDFDEKTERGTPRKHQKAREKGQVARSRELVSMAATAGIIVMFYFSGSSFIEGLSEMMKRLLTLQYGFNPMLAMRFAATDMLRILLPFLLVSFTFALVSGAAQGGFVFKPFGFEFERLNPVEGFKRLFSRYSVVDFIKSFFKFVVGACIFYLVVKKLIVVLPLTAVADVREIFRIFLGLLFRAVMLAFVTFLVFAVADYFYERWRFERSLRMTKEEVRQEYKEMEGDPLIKSRIKSIQKEMARRRMMQEVPKATVVVTNPTHIAVALQYRKDETAAPMVIAKGAGFVAEKIREIARSHRVPVVEDKPLARALYKLHLHSFIPVDLYKAVAKILAYIYNLRGAA